MAGHIIKGLLLKLTSRCAQYITLYLTIQRAIISMLFFSRWFLCLLSSRKIKASPVQRRDAADDLSFCCWNNLLILLVKHLGVSTDTYIGAGIFDLYRKYYDVYSIYSSLAVYRVDLLLLSRIVYRIMFLQQYEVNKSTQMGKYRCSLNSTSRMSKLKYHLDTWDSGALQILRL